MAEARENIAAEIAIVGAGPAGIAAACRAAESGARVVLVDEAPRAGGQIWRHRKGAAPSAARAWLARLETSGARVVTGASVVSRLPDGALLADAGGQSLTIRAPRLVLATGARELFLPFPGWTLPGVMGAGGAQALLKSGASFRGKRVIVAGSGPLLLPAAASLAKAGARVILVAEQAPAEALARFGRRLVTSPAKIFDAVRYALAFRPDRLAPGTWVAEARGEGRLEEVVVTTGRSSRRLACDVLAVSFGLVPNLELPRLLGCALVDGFVAVDGDQRTNVDGVFCAGEPTGIGGVDRALVEGEIAGFAAAGRPVPERLRARRERLGPFVAALAETFALRDALRRLPRPETIVCRCEDVPLGRIEAGSSARRAKLHARVGMGACQGRTCGPALRFLLGASYDPDGTGDSVRPPLKPVPLSLLEVDR